MEQTLNETSFSSENISSMNILELIDKITNNKIDCKILSSKFVYSYLYDKRIDINDYFEYAYKNINKFNFYNNLLNNFPIDDKLITSLSNDIFEFFINDLIKIDKGQFLLRKFEYKKILDMSDDGYLLKLYFNSGVSSTLPVFLMIDSLIKNKGYIDEYSKSILSAVCRNSDDRLIKYVVKNFETYHVASWNNTQFIKCVIQNIFSEHIPTKYILRRLKLLNQKIDLSPHFPMMIQYVDNIELFVTLNKYYNINNIHDKKINNIQIVTKYVSCDIDAEKLINIFKSTEKKLQVCLSIFKAKRRLYGLNIVNYINSETDYDFYNTYVTEIVSSIIHGNIESIYSSYNFDDLKKILLFYTPSHLLLRQKYIKNYIFLLPFLKYFPNGGGYNSSKQLATKLNLIRTTLKLWLRKKYKINRIENKVNILKKSTNEDKKYIIDSFNKIPPRLLLPYELNDLENYLIREKADGCLVDYISYDVEPFIGQYTNTNIKAEFIEDLDLFLIFDLEINDMTSVERYNYLRSLHPDTKDRMLTQVNTYDELIEKIKEERILLNNFLKKPYDNYRVYPKAAWLVNNKSLNIDIINNIIEEDDYKYICKQGPYNNDGLIITPLNGNRELKVKPKSYQTIDLLFDGTNWLDQEKNSLNEIVFTDKEFDKDKIWRCYPLFKANNMLIFEPKEFRFDKMKPNNSKIIQNVIDSCVLNWKKTLGQYNSSYYNGKNIKKENWKEIVKIQNLHLEYILDQVNPEFKLSWLDLGCGSAKLLKYIKKYHFLDYTGVDNDRLQMIYAENRIDKDHYFTDKSKVILSNLNNDWNILKNQYYDIVVANFSLHYYYSDKFWINMKNIIKQNGIFIFNLVNNNAKDKWIDGNNYLYLEENIVKYYFESVHSKEMEEKYIEKEKILKACEEYNLELIDEFTPNGNNLDSKYTWFIIKFN